MCRPKFTEMREYFHQLALLNSSNGQLQARDANRHARDMMQAVLDQLDDEQAKKAADEALYHS